MGRPNTCLPRAAPLTLRGPTDRPAQRPSTSQKHPPPPRRPPSHLHVPQQLEDLHGAVHDVLDRLLPDPAQGGRVDLPRGLRSLGPGEGPGRHPRRSQRRGGHGAAAASGPRGRRRSVRGGPVGVEMSAALAWEGARETPAAGFQNSGRDFRQR